MGQTLDAEALVVRQVQVQDVQLHGGHGVEIALDHLDGLPAPRHVDHEPPPWESRPVPDRGRRKKPAVLVPLGQLQERLEAVEGAEIR